MIQKSLQKIGLNKKEITIFISSLKYGSQPASVIAKNTEIPRPTVYDVFHSLIKKGLAHKTEKGATTYFQVLNPENLLRYLDRECDEIVRKTEQQKKEIENLLPELKSLQHLKSSRPKVKFFEGKRGMKEAYEDTLTSTEDIRAYANVEEVHQALPHFFPDYYKRRAEAGISIRGIFPDNEISKLREKQDAVESRESKFIDKEKYNFTPELNVYDNKIMIASWKEKMALLIESEEIAEFHKAIFDLLWEKIKKE